MVKRRKMNKAMIESLLRHVLSAGLAALTGVMAVEGAVSPTDLSTGAWFAVLAALWAALVPTAIRYLNKKDPAFGLVAQLVATSVASKLETAAAKPAAKAPARKPAAKKPETKK
jgi:hypothetical protein